MRDPTVNCEPVAMRAEPDELETMIEFGANEVAPVPPEAMVLVNEVRQLLLTAKHPPFKLSPTLLVVVAKPTMLSPRSVVVPNPVPETERAPIEVLAYVVSEEVPR